MTTEIQAFAALDGEGNIDVATIYSHEVGALVNGLMRRGIVAMMGTSDDAIRKAATDIGVVAVPVTITRRTDA
jgi:hypothetical protein